MRIVILGAGAVGSLIGGYLFKSGQEAILVCSREHAKEINKNGLRINGIQGELSIPIPAVDSISDITWRDDDIVFLTTKTFDTPLTIESLEGVAANLEVVCFQNGVRNEAIACKKFKKVYGGIVSLFVKYLEPGIITHVEGNQLGIGLYPEGLDPTIESLTNILTKANFSVNPYSNVMALKWSKLFHNLNNALFAIIGLPVMEGVKYESVRFLMADILDEALRAYQAENIEIIPLPGDQPPEETIKNLRIEGDFQYETSQDEEKQMRPSTWQDLYLRRKRTEVEYFNGEIVKLGTKHGVPTPFNSTMTSIVIQMSEDGIAPGTYDVDFVRDSVIKALSRKK